MKNVIDLADKKILVTGASSGIGRATAILLSQVGAQVVLAARNEERLKETISMMDQPERHRYYAIDLSKLDEIGQMIDECVKRDGKKFDGAVHCAGVAAVFPINALSYEKLDDTMRIHCYAYIEMIKQLSKRKNKEERCNIVGISSKAVDRGGKCQTAYAAAKAGMDAATLILSKELAGKGMRINTVRPGWVNTDMMMDHCAMKNITAEALGESQALGMAEPEDIANMAVFLLSDASSNVTGKHFDVDGGGAR